MKKQSKQSPGSSAARVRSSQGLHPAQQFTAPGSMERDVPLKEILGPRSIELLADCLAAVVPGFGRKRFVRGSLNGLEPLGIMERGHHIARAMAGELPGDFSKAAPLLVASLGPPLERTEGNGLAVFFYLPHVSYVTQFGLGHFDEGMRANYEITQRFSAEFSIRPFLMKYQSPSLRLLRKWAKDRNPHVRRLVSEGTRPRLPWASRLPEFQKNPELALPLLELLKDDPELYVRRSVANHLGDMAKDHPEFAMDVCERWIAELEDGSHSPGQADQRRWLVRHAVRLPAKKGDRRALEIRRRAAAARVREKS